MTKEEAVERIINEVKDQLLKQMYPMVHGNGYPSQAVPHATIIDIKPLVKDKLTAILTELMEPIGEEEIREWAALKTGNVITDCSENYYNGVIEGAKWAATRNLKLSLEGLKRYNSNLDQSPDGLIVYLSDVEKLVR